MESVTDKGMLYGVSVGPGDPELLTLKAVRVIRAADVIAVPGAQPETSLAYRIAAEAVPQLREKSVTAVAMPMTRDPEVLQKAHREAADHMEALLDAGKTVVYLTLGDISIYGSFSYLQRLLEQDGYPVETVSGVPSFCAAASRLHIPLTAGDIPLHIIPAGVQTGTHTGAQTDEQEETYRREQAGEWLRQPGTCVLMKAGNSLRALKESLRDSGKEVYGIQACGFAEEKRYFGMEELPDKAGYLTLLIIKEREEA